MKQEDKELLFKDFCARLPYGVICKILYTFNNETTDWEDVKSTCDDIVTQININTKEVFSDWLSEYSSVENVKPYFRPMSSMTEEEKEEYTSILGWEFLSLEAVDWLNAHHFDYRGLIEKGLAIEAPEGMYSLA